MLVFRLLAQRSACLVREVQVKRVARILIAAAIFAASLAITSEAAAQGRAVARPGPRHVGYAAARPYPYYRPYYYGPYYRPYYAPYYYSPGFGVGYGGFGFGIGFGWYGWPGAYGYP